MFTRILVAVDADEIDDAVIDATIGLAQPLHAQVAILHVVSTAEAIAPMLAASETTGMGVPTMAAADYQLTEQILEEQEEGSKTLIHNLASRFPAGIPTETLIREGATAETVIATAQEWQANLIIIGTHGRKGLERLVLGSTAEAVIRAAPCPVLTIRFGTKLA